MAAQPQFQEFPKVMAHPNHRPATTRIIPNAPGTPGILKPGSEGTSVFLPDVTVVNEDEEAQYRAKGYRPVGEADPAAYARAVAGAPPLGVEVQAYPKWKYHAAKDACIVDTPEQERALGAGWADRPDLVAPLPIPGQGPAVTPEVVEASRKGPAKASSKPAKRAKKKAKRHVKAWTPERRAAQSEAMKARIAAKKTKSEQPAAE
jgi:hypothetical protein